MCQLRYRKDTEPLYNAFLAFRLYWNLFWLPMTSPTESFNPSFYTPLYKKEQNEREIIQWRLLSHLSSQLANSFNFRLDGSPHFQLKNFNKLSYCILILLFNARSEEKFVNEMNEPHDDFNSTHYTDTNKETQCST